MTTVLEPCRKNTNNPSDYVPVAVVTLSASETRAFDLHARSKSRREFVLYCDRALHLTDETLARLLASGVLTLYVHSDEAAVYNAYLQELISSANGITTEKRYEILSAAAQSLLSQAFQKQDTATLLPLLTNVGAQIVNCLSQPDTALRTLFSLMAHDYLSFTHASNVSTYCVLLAQELGVVSQSELTQIAVGGLLHDLGKRHLESTLLNKNGALTDREKDLVRAHPKMGFEDLYHRSDLTWGQLMMVYQHHERLNGSGYPVRITADEIHPWAKICAVADVFDAMTADRPYRRAKPIAETLDYLRQRSDSLFDKETVECLISQMSAS